MTNYYTIAVRERGKMQAYQYIGVDGCVYVTTTYSKPLTLADARLARRLLIEGAAKANRPIGLSHYYVERVVSRLRRFAGAVR